MVYYCDSGDCPVFMYVPGLQAKCPCCQEVGTEVEKSLQRIMGTIE
jgi:hypothetical protein